MARTFAVCVLLSAALLPKASVGRSWTDSSGAYQIQAELVAFNATHVVLKKRSRDLVAFPIEKLSTADREYLKSQPAAPAAGTSADQAQTWTMRSGLKVVGTVVDYARRDIIIARPRGELRVNGHRLENLSDVYRPMIPRIVAHFEKQPIDSEAALDAWLAGVPGQARTYRIEGVLMELGRGDEYGVPFFFFSDDDLKFLKPGWDRWLAAVNNREQQRQGHEALLLQAQARAYQQDRSATQLIAELHLDLEAYREGAFDLWEVMLYPGLGVSGPSLSVVIPATDSRRAGLDARKRYPGYQLGPISKVSRR